MTRGKRAREAQVTRGDPPREFTAAAEDYRGRGM